MAKNVPFNQHQLVLASLFQCIFVTVSRGLVLYKYLLEKILTSLHINEKIYISYEWE